VCGALEGGDFDRLARMQQDGGPGMRSVDESLARAVARRHVTLREAAAKASDRNRMVSLVRSLARRRAR
jgi:Tfp pilus assembly pilus retraction ATPase PilT